MTISVQDIQIAVTEFKFEDKFPQRYIAIFDTV